MRNRSEIDVPEMLLTALKDGGCVGVLLQDNPNFKRGKKIFWNCSGEVGVAEVIEVNPREQCFCLIVKDVK